MYSIQISLLPFFVIRSLHVSYVSSIFGRLVVYNLDSILSMLPNLSRISFYHCRIAQWLLRLLLCEPLIMFMNRGLPLMARVSSRSLDGVSEKKGNVFHLKCESSHPIFCWVCVWQVCFSLWIFITQMEFSFLFAKSHTHTDQQSFNQSHHLNLTSELLCRKRFSYKWN